MLAIASQPRPLPSPTHCRHRHIPELICEINSSIDSEILVENRRFEPTAPVSGTPTVVVPLEFREGLWHQETFVPRLSYMALFPCTRFSRFGRTPTCDRQTDERTRPNFTKCSTHVTCGRGSVFLWFCVFCCILWQISLTTMRQVIYPVLWTTRFHIIGQIHLQG